MSLLSNQYQPKQWQLLILLSQQLSFVGRQDSVLDFSLAQGQSALYDHSHQERLAELLSGVFKQALQVTIQVTDSVGATPAALAQQRKEQRQQAAQSAILNDPVVQQLQETFGAEVLMDTIKPID